MNMAAFGKKLREAWEASGMTQEDVVAGTDLNVRTFQRLMSGEGNPSLNTVLGLCRSLKMEPGWLLSDANTPAGRHLPVPGLVDFQKAVSFFSKLSNSPRDIQMLILAILYNDPTYLESASPKFQRKAIALVKGALGP